MLGPVKNRLILKPVTADIRKLFVTVGWMLPWGIANAQIDLLDSISSRQIHRDSFYTTGLFPSQIVWRGTKKSASLLLELEKLSGAHFEFDVSRIKLIRRV
jgi:hypothetical protein